MEIKFLKTEGNETFLLVETEDFKAEVKIADHDDMVYVRMIIPTEGGEKLNSFKFKSELENTMVVLYNQEYRGKLK